MKKKEIKKREKLADFNDDIWFLEGKNEIDNYYIDSLNRKIPLWVKRLIYTLYHKKYKK